jgi:hypothetical protein
VAVSIKELKPYTSVVLARTNASRDAAGVVDDVLDALAGLLRLDDPDAPAALVSRVGPQQTDELQIGFLHYEERRQPGWTADHNVIDVLNHLALVAVRGRYAAILVTDAARAPQISRAFDRPGDSPLGALSPVDAGSLNAAFVTGAARTLWLSGIHARSTVKADSKILIGTDLRDALDPLGDQSYYFTAVRAVADLGYSTTTIGVSPRKSRVWAGASRSWSDFQQAVTGILTVLERTEEAGRSEASPLPILAAPVKSAEGVAGAFDLTILPPEVAGDELDVETRERLEKLAYHTTFVVSPTTGPDFEADVLREDTLLGRVAVHVEVAGPERVTARAESTPQVGFEQDLAEVGRACEDRSWLTVRYDTGHTLSGGVLWSPHFREVSFRNWGWTDLADFDIRKEKPTLPGTSTFDPALIGEQDSLFCWVARNWPTESPALTGRGWLACDDGSGEIADFIHLTNGPDPLLSLIHVKGCHGDVVPGRSRAIAVSDYEVVTAQALKNLRRLDRTLLSQDLRASAGSRVGTAVWHDGVKQDGRTGMLDALADAGGRYRRQVVVLQPRVWRNDLEAARAAWTSDLAHRPPPVQRLLQLETLLASVESNCGSLGATLLVLADGSPPATP